MKPLGKIERILMVGGAARSGAKKTVARTTKTKGSRSALSSASKSVEMAASANAPKPKAKREAKLLTKLNDNFYNAGQVAIASFSVAEHFNYSIPKLVSAIGQDEDNFSKHSRREPKLLRPNFRFSRNYWNSSISYGTPG